MSETFFDDSQPQPQQNQNVATIRRKDLRRLETAAKDGRQAKADLEKLQREVAFFQAGVPSGDDRARYFIEGYKGDPDPAAIKAEWDRVFGQSRGGPDAGPPPAVENELNQMASGQALTTGGTELPPDRLAERNQKLAGLSMSDPAYDQKFAAIMDEYGSPMGSLNG